jgi:adenylate kinase family enzyme
MTRVAIIGNAGGGKSTLAAALGQALGLPVHHIDRIQYQPGWQLSAPEFVAQEHRRILDTQRWIIDGWGGWPLIQARFEAADAVVVVDFPLWRHVWWALKRQVMHPFGRTPDRPENCPLLPMTWQLARAIWHVHRNLRPELLRRVSALASDSQVFVLRSPRELAEFARQHCQSGAA